MQEEEESKSTSQKRKNEDEDRWNGVCGKVGRKEHVAEEDGKDDVQEFGGKEKEVEDGGEPGICLFERQVHRGDETKNWTLQPRRPVSWLGDSNMDRL